MVVVYFRDTYCDRSRCMVHYTRINLIENQRIYAAVTINIERVVMFLAGEGQGAKGQNPYPT
jgi:hypothetical protein